MPSATITIAVGVLRIPDADAATMMERDPRGAARGLQQCSDQRPVGHGVRAVLHRLGLAVPGLRPNLESR